MELLRSVDVAAPGRPGPDDMARRSYTLGHNHVEQIAVLPDLRVEVRLTGREPFYFWPANVVLGVPLRESCPVQPVPPLSGAPCDPCAAAPQPGSHSGVAQSAEQLAVNQPVESSILSPGAVPAGGDNRARESGTPSASKTEKLGSTPSEPAEEAARNWRGRKGKR